MKTLRFYQYFQKKLKMFNLFKRQLKKTTEEEIKLEVIKGIINRILSAEFERIKTKHKELKKIEGIVEGKRKDFLKAKNGELRNMVEISDKEKELDDRMHRAARETTQKNDDNEIYSKELKAQLNLIKWLKKS